MNILLVIDCLGSGGAQRQMVTLAKGLCARGHKVYVANYYPQLDHFRAELVNNGIVVLDCNKSFRWSFMPIFALWRWLRLYRVDVAVSFLTTPNVYLIVACRILARVPCVVSERSMFKPGQIRLARRAVYALYRFANIVTVNSFHQRDAIAGRFPFLAASIRCIYNGVDLDRFLPSHENGDEGRREITLLSIASVATMKNALGLAHALSSCRKKGLEVTILWAGEKSTSSEGSAPFELVCHYLQDAGLDGFWHWLGPRVDIPELISSADAVIHPSYFEGLPNVICEALASGKIVLAGRVCDNAKLLGNGAHGILFDPADPSDMCAAICKFASLEARQRIAMEEQARTYAEENLGNNRLCDAYEREFKIILEADK